MIPPEVKVVVVARPRPAEDVLTHPRPFSSVPAPKLRPQMIMEDVHTADSKLSWGPAFCVFLSIVMVLSCAVGCAYFGKNHGENDGYRRGVVSGRNQANVGSVAPAATQE